MEGYLYPSFTGGMVTQFKSEAAVEMFQFLKDLWPYVHEQSITYSQMQEPCWPVKSGSPSTTPPA
jgi:multiple sugar transport system substrate-binding protein